MGPEMVGEASPWLRGSEGENGAVRSWAVPRRLNGRCSLGPLASPLDPV